MPLCTDTMGGSVDRRILGGKGKKRKVGVRSESGDQCGASLELRQGTDSTRSTT